MNLVVDLRFGGGACGKRWGDYEPYDSTRLNKLNLF